MLELKNLTKRYGNGTVALHNVSLEFDRGVLGLLGANGAGKTTLMSILATVQTPSSGSARWRGEDIVKNPAPLRRELGYLPQDFGVYDRLDAREFLTYLGRLKGLSGKALKQRIDNVLEIVNLQHTGSRRLGAFSGGMRQRVGIAQALLGEARLLIVDEPTVGLDPEERLRFRHLLSEIAHDRVVILSTHIVSDIEAIASRIAVLRKGELLFAGEPEEMLQRAGGAVFTARIEADQLAPLQQQVKIANVQRKSDALMIRFVGHAPSGLEATAVEPTLEDAYLLLDARAGLHAVNGAAA